MPTFPYNSLSLYPSTKAGPALNKFMLEDEGHTVQSPEKHLDVERSPGLSTQDMILSFRFPDRLVLL